MCRLFGFRSNESARVHAALVTERNALRLQSIEHRDGWGIAHYDADGRPCVTRGLGPALHDPEFERISSGLSARAVVAHLRLASVGAVELCNVHPFVRGHWTFAHNGTLRDFAKHQTAIEARIHPTLRSSFQSNTDSERAFLLFLSHLGDPDAGTSPPVEQVASALARTMNDLAALTDPGDGSGQRSAMNFLVTDGRVLVATRRDKSLFFSLRTDPVAPLREAPPPGTPLRQLVVASEQLSLGEPWFTVPQDGLVGVDAALRFQRWSASDF